MPRQQVFDYVIVGGGSAGCVLANHLSANERDSVCLLEAGPPDRSLLIRMPAGIGYLVPGQRYNLHHYTQPQTELKGRRLYWPRGRTLGGSSSINAMVYMRGNSGDYDAWEAAGNPGWGWSGMLPYFLLSEGNARGGGAFHSSCGPLAVSDLKWTSEAGRAFLRAAQSAGHSLNNDFNGDRQLGVGFYQVTQRHGRRCSSAGAYLRPVRNRVNLKVSTNSQVAKLLFRGDRVCGVQLLNGRRVLAQREVLLCAGAIQSPQLLLLSGIGPETELRSLGIATQAHLPGVGKNLQDHLDITQVVETSAPIGFSESLGAKLKMALHLPEFLLAGTGPLTNNVAEAGGFACSSKAGVFPDVQFHLSAAPLFDHGRRKTKGFGYSLHTCALRPHSRGEIKLQSTDPRAQPLIQPNYLSAAEDLAVMAEGYEMAAAILEQEDLKKYRKRLWSPTERLPNRCEIENFIRQYAETIYHPAGTCKMGGDDMAVVDAELKVRGVNGLRVVDASIMPTLISGNTNAPVMAIAEKAADMILRQQRVVPESRLVKEAE
ncbi:GMC family oxidoreductase [Microbulbifer sp. TYP-18]|uniref:GMC family oxidoreductase n=1 Tax=Microbulbifer sp. TYP-18 TaxID=3230024 RepID=UPI0034C67254